VTARPPFLSHVALTILLGFYGWALALIVGGASGSSAHGGVTLQHWLAGVLVVYLGGLVWAVGYTGSFIVASARSGFSALYIVGYGPRLARVRVGKSRLELRLWPVRANWIPDESPASPTLRQQARILRSGLWSGIIIAAVLSGLAPILPGTSWVLALAAFPLVLGLNGLLQRRVTSPAGQLRVIKDYPEACELRNEANAAMGRNDFERALTLSTQALRNPSNSVLTLQFHVVAAVAGARLGRYSDSADHWAAVGEVAADGRIKAAAAGNVADAKLAEALRTRAAVPEQDLEQFRSALGALPAPITQAEESARLHFIAMLRLAEGDAAEAVSLCKRSLRIDSESDAAGDRPMVLATLVIAHARSGGASEARRLLAELSPTHPLYGAAAAELAAAVDGSASGA
jgi:tetratricopeptide (TPR) repeat protein